MGNRVVVGFQNRADDPVLYLYSHWGDETYKDLAEGLKKAAWSDPAYATRVVISHIIGDNWDGTKNYGLSVGSFGLPDYDDLYIVRWHNKSVSVVDAFNPETEYYTISIDELIEVHDKVSPTINDLKRQLEESK